MSQTKVAETITTHISYVQLLFPKTAVNEMWQNMAEPHIHAIDKNTAHALCTLYN